jgi:hypothetical protein
MHCLKEKYQYDDMPISGWPEFPATVFSTYGFHNRYKVGGKRIGL